MTRLQITKLRAARSVLAGAALLIAAGLPVGASAGADQLRDVLELQSEIAGKLDSTAAQAKIEQTLDRLDNLSIEELDALAEVDRAAARLMPVLQILNQSLDEAADSTVSAAPAAALTPVPPGLSTPLTAPNYFADAACPFGERNSSLTVFISEQALFVAEEIRELASRGCNQIGVVAGFGANTSLACIASDVVFIVAKEVNNVLNFCDATVDAAETEGAFERTGDIFANLNEHHANLSLHDDNLGEHDADIKALLGGLQDAVDENTRRLGEVIRLLHTPQGRRRSSTPVCNGGTCKWPFRGS